MPQPKPFNQSRKAAGKKLAKQTVKKAAAERAAVRGMASTAIQMAIPIPTKKIKLAAKGATKVVKALTATAKAKPASKKNVKKYAEDIRNMLNEPDYKKRVAMSKKIVKKRSK